MSFEITEDAVLKIPKDETKEAVILNVDKVKRKEIYNQEVIDKNKLNPEEEMLKITYEIKIEGKPIINSDNLVYYETPHPSSKLGKYLTKYKTTKVGTVIKIYFNSDGFGHISLN